MFTCYRLCLLIAAVILNFIQHTENPNRAFASSPPAGPASDEHQAAAIPSTMHPDVSHPELGKIGFEWNPRPEIYQTDPAQMRFFFTSSPDIEGRATERVIGRLARITGPTGSVELEADTTLNKPEWWKLPGVINEVEFISDAYPTSPSATIGSGAVNAITKLMQTLKELCADVTKGMSIGKIRNKNGVIMFNYRRDPYCYVPLEITIVNITHEEGWKAELIGSGDEAVRRVGGIGFVIAYNGNKKFWPINSYAPIVTQVTIGLPLSYFANPNSIKLLFSNDVVSALMTNASTIRLAQKDTPNDATVDGFLNLLCLSAFIQAGHGPDRTGGHDRQAWSAFLKTPLKRLYTGLNPVQQTSVNNAVLEPKQFEEKCLQAAQCALRKRPFFGRNYHDKVTPEGLKKVIVAIRQTGAAHYTQPYATGKHEGTEAMEPDNTLALLELRDRVPLVTASKLNFDKAGRAYLDNAPIRNELQKLTDSVKSTAPPKKSSCVVM